MAVIITQFQKNLYQTASRGYGPLVDKFRQDFPKNLALAHICYVNPNLYNDPALKNADKGFLGTSVAATRRTNVPWIRLSDPLTCAFVWFTDANLSSYTFYMSHPTLFLTPNEDFWKCAYLNIVLEDAAFESLWGLINPLAGDTDIYGQLRSKVQSLRGGLTGWPIIKLQKCVLQDLEVVFALAKTYSPLTSSGFGRPPYLKSNDASRIFVE